jgi:hypothetical protein
MTRMLLLAPPITPCVPVAHGAAMDSCILEPNFAMLRTGRRSPRTSSAAPYTPASTPTSFRTASRPRSLTPPPWVLSP